MFDVYAQGQGLAKGVSAEQCWAIVSDHSGWQRWLSMIAESTLTSPGEDEPNGIGARRHFRDSQGGGFAEVINIYMKPRLFGYHICEEAPLKDHQGVISLTPTAAGTEILWYMSANNNGYIGDDNQRAAMRAVMQTVMDTAIADLVRACEAAAGSK